MTRVLVVHHDLDMAGQEVDSLRRFGYEVTECGGPTRNQCPVLAGHACVLAEQADVLVSPTSPFVAFGIGERMGDPMAMYVNDLCTLPASLAGTPAISVPCGLSEGLPVGMQIMAPALADDRCYRVAAAFEAAVEPVLASIPELSR